MGRSIDNPWKARSTWTLQSVQMRQVKQWEVIPNCTLSKDVRSEQRWGWCGRCIVYVCQTKSLLALLWVWAEAEAIHGSSLGVKLEVQTCTACFGTKVLGSRHVEGAPNGNLQQKVAGRTMQLCFSLGCFVHVLKHDFGIFWRWSRGPFPTWTRYQQDSFNIRLTEVKGPFYRTFSIGFRCSFVKVTAGSTMSGVAFRCLKLLTL